MGLCKVFPSRYAGDTVGIVAVGFVTCAALRSEIVLVTRIRREDAFLRRVTGFVSLVIPQLSS